MIRVLHVMGRMAPGGTEHQLVGMLEAAHGRYWEATLCVLSTGWPLSQRARAAGIPVLEIDGAGRADPRRALHLRRLGKNTQVLHASLPLASTFARLTNVGPNRPALVVSERGVERRRPLAFGMTNRLLGPLTDAYIGNSTAVTTFIRSTHGVGDDDLRVVEIPNGLDTEIFYPARRPFRPDSDRVPPARPAGRRARLIGVGRLISSKRFDLVIALLPQLAATIEIELVLIGDGPERTRLEAMARGLPVTFLGHVADRHELADLLRASDVLVMPSASEGYPNAVLEALGCGLPVVASDIPGNRAAAGEGVRLVNGDAESWCRAIAEAVADGPIANSRLAGRVLSFDEVALRHLDVFKRAIDHRHRVRTAPQHPSATGTGS